MVMRAERSVGAGLSPAEDLLDRMQEVWEFDPTDAVLTRSFSVSGGKARAEIDVSALGLADVLAILDETRPAW